MSRKRKILNESNNCQVNSFKRKFVSPLSNISIRGDNYFYYPRIVKKKFPSLNFIPPQWISIEYSYTRIVTTNIRSCGNILVNSKGTNLYWQILRKFRVVRHRLDVSGEIRFRLTSHGIPFALESLNTLPDFDDPSKRDPAFESTRNACC